MVRPVTSEYCNNEVLLHGCNANVISVTACCDCRCQTDIGSKLEEHIRLLQCIQAGDTVTECNTEPPPPQNIPVKGKIRVQLCSDCSAHRCHIIVETSSLSFTLAI